jgi:hypothetical protein
VLIKRYISKAIIVPESRSQHEAIEIKGESTHNEVEVTRNEAYGTMDQYN